MFARVRAVLFDFDGTLVEPSIDFGEMRRAVLKVVEAFGIETTPYVSMHVLELVERVRQTIGPEKGERFEAEAQRAILGIELAAAERVRAYPGVPAMMAELADRGLRVGIVTRNCRPAVERILERIPLEHQVLVTRDDTEHVKPDPRHLAAALEPLAVPGHLAVMCGDHVMDVVAGQRLGAMTVGVLAPNLPADYFHEVGPDLVLSDVTQISRHLPSFSGIAPRAADRVEGDARV